MFQIPKANYSTVADRIEDTYLDFWLDLLAFYGYNLNEVKRAFKFVDVK